MGADGHSIMYEPPFQAAEWLATLPDDGTHPRDSLGSASTKRRSRGGRLAAGGERRRAAV